MAGRVSFRYLPIGEGRRPIACFHQDGENRLIKPQSWMVKKVFGVPGDFLWTDREVHYDREKYFIQDLDAFTTNYLLWKHKISLTLKEGNIFDKEVKWRYRGDTNMTNLEHYITLSDVFYRPDKQVVATMDKVNLNATMLKGVLLERFMRIVKDVDAVEVPEIDTNPLFYLDI